jgi:hypothetical protein
MQIWGLAARRGVHRGAAGDLVAGGGGLGVGLDLVVRGLRLPADPAAPPAPRLEVTRGRLRRYRRNPVGESSGKADTEHLRGSAFGEPRTVPQRACPVA